MKADPEDPRTAELHSFGEESTTIANPTPTTSLSKKEKNPNHPPDHNPWTLPKQQPTKILCPFGTPNKLLMPAESTNSTSQPLKCF